MQQTAMINLTASPFELQNRTVVALCHGNGDTTAHRGGDLLNRRGVQKFSACTLGSTSDANSFIERSASSSGIPPYLNTPTNSSASTVCLISRSTSRHRSGVPKHWVRPRSVASPLLPDDIASAILAWNS